MGTRDAYGLLEVDPSARQEVIVAAYRALRRLRHPDGRDADRAWKAELEWAYRTLSSPVTRHAYDRDRHWSQMQPVGPGQPRPVYLSEGPYAGWRVDQVAGHDIDYLQRLLHRSNDDAVVAEIRAVLEDRG